MTRSYVVVMSVEDVYEILAEHFARDFPWRLDTKSPRIKLVLTDRDGDPVELSSIEDVTLEIPFATDGTPEPALARRLTDIATNGGDS